MDDVNRPPPYTTAVPPYATTGIPYTAAGVPPYVIGKPRDDFRYQATEFFKGVAELSVEFGKGCRDVVKQSLLRDDSFIVRCFGGVCKSACVRFKFLNRYLPEDRDPMHSWTVISVVFAVVLAVLLVTSESDTTAPMIERLQIYPPNATRILLPDGRHLAYQEQGVPPDRARYTLVTSHSFLSSRLAGIPGIKDSLLQEFGVRLVSYDLPGFGESYPHPGRNLESSALDLLFLSYVVHITDKFWVVGYSGGSMHTWAALKYIPDRIAEYNPT